MKMPQVEIEEPDINVSALIDMVFLLLVYFMVAATLHRSEADLGIRLPGMMSEPVQVDVVAEQMIEVQETGRIILNGKEFDDPESTELPELVTMLIQYRQSMELAKQDPLITILGDDEALHQRVVDVMNACAVAGIKNITFTASSE
ncbi:MAG: biopolymer transporter ExbD [Kiritimatiellia bacterium]|nr:biopolymer transporter ExbD [Kiritimatiellia bacterium]